MKYLERIIIFLSSLILVAILGLALFWIGRVAVMIATGSPAMAPYQIAAAPEAKATEPDSSAEKTAAATTAQADTAAAPAAAGSDPAPAVQVSAAAGEKVFRKCKACHSADANKENKTGPYLWSVLNRPVASAEGFAYSDAITAHQAETWSPDQLDAFLADPKAFAPGNKMTFAGLKKEADRQNVILYLAQQADTPLSAAELGFAAAAAAAGATAAADDATAEADPDAPVEIDPIPYPEGVSYQNAPAPTAEDQARIDALVSALEDLAPTLDYERARFHPMHFPPQATDASNAECLVCHQEILDHQPREASQAGVPASDTMAWYQTLDTYGGDQASFHWRHLESDYAKSVMNLECSFCHKGNDPREESPDMVPNRAAFAAADSPEFTLRKMVNPSETCLLCHGAMPDPVGIMGLAGPWHEVREDMEWPEAPNGCLTCHAETYRTVRHNVDYLNAANIEEIARNGSSDSCYGCHGGRAWYRISYPYARQAWPDMDPELPDWASDRPAVPYHALPSAE